MVTTVRVTVQAKRGSGGRLGWPHYRRASWECPATGTFKQPWLRALKNSSFLEAVGWAVGSLSVLFLEETKLDKKTLETRAWREPSRRAGTGKELLL